MTVHPGAAERAIGIARPSPYQGLVPYREADADWFFGREEWCGVIGDNLRAYRITVLYGASGCGKSSVLRAGVARRLREEARDNVAALGVPRLLPVVFSDWSLDDPLGALRDVVATGVRALAPAFARDDDERPLTESLGAWAERIEGPLLIVLDQLEDLFRYHDQPDNAALAELGDILRSRDPTTHFLLSIREDALANLDRFTGYVPGLLERLLRLEHLDRDAAREAIVEPLLRWNQTVAEPSEQVEAEPALVEAVLDQVTAGKVSLDGAGEGPAGNSSGTGVEAPYLQLVLTRLWDEEHRRWAEQGGPRHLRMETLERLGGAERVVRTHLDTALAALPKREQDLAGRTLRYLVTPSGTKTALRIADLADFAQVSEDRLDPLVTLLAGDVRILREAGDGRFEIYHDALAGPILDWRRRWDERQRNRPPFAVLPLGLAGAALLAVGIFMRWDDGHSFLQNDFGGWLPHGGALTSLAPICVVVAAILGTLLAFARPSGTPALGAGVLLGAGIAGASTYLAILVNVVATPTVRVGVGGAVVGGILVVAAGVLAAGASVPTQNARNVAAAIAGVVGAAVMTVAIAIPFNQGGSNLEPQKVARSVHESFGPVVTSVAVAVIAALLIGRRRHMELSSALLTLGLLAALLWSARYIGVPLLEDSLVASLGPGGFVGLAGAGLVVLGGYLGLRALRAHESPDLVAPGEPYYSLKSG